MDEFTTSDFGNRDRIKAALATLLPRHKPTERLEIFARQCGHRTDAAMTAFSEANTGCSPRFLPAGSRAAATGNTLPLLVFSACSNVLATQNTRSTAQPQVPSAPTILRNALETIDKTAFGHTLNTTDIMKGAHTAVHGAPRWFFAVATSSALFATERTHVLRIRNPHDADELIRAARTMLCGILGLATLIDHQQGCNQELFEDLFLRGQDQPNPWDNAAYELIAKFDNTSSHWIALILSSIREQLPQTDPNTTTTSPWIQKGIGIHPDMDW